MSEVYVIGAEEELIRHILQNNGCAAKALDKINASFFSSKYHHLMGYIIQYHNRYRKIPTRDIMQHGLNQISAEDTNARTQYSHMLAQYDFLTKDNPLSNFDGFEKWLDEVICYREINECITTINTGIQIAQPLNQPGVSTNLEEIKNNLKDKFENTVNFMRSVENHDRSSLINLRDEADFLWEEYVEGEKNPEANTNSVSFGMPMLDQHLYGLTSGLMTIGGASGDGKSTLILNMGINLFMQNKNVLYVSVELTKKQLMHRFCCSYAQLQSDRLIKFQLLGDEKPRYREALTQLQKVNSNFYILDLPREVSMAEVENSYNTICLEQGRKIDAVILDYMGLMRPSFGTKNMPDWQMLDTVSREVHEFTRATESLVITASQLTRLKDNVEDYYSQDRFSRAKGVVENSDFVIQLKRNDASQTQSEMNSMIIKNRFGPAWRPVEFFKDFSRFYVGNPTAASYNDDNIRPTTNPGFTPVEQ